jgi:hypothetical protein
MEITAAQRCLTPSQAADRWFLSNRAWPGMAEFLSNATEHWQQIAGDTLLVCASCQTQFIEITPDAQLLNKSNNSDSCFPLLVRPLGFSKIPVLLGWLRTGLQNHEESNQSHAVLKVVHCIFTTIFSLEIRTG